MKNIKLKEIHKKIIVSVLVITIGVLSYTSVLDTLMKKTFVNELDEKGSEYYNETMSRSIYTFAIVRGINGVISVLQGTGLAVSPAGVGVSLSVGEILDPINDLVERFSWVMLVSSTSLGIQKVLMEMGIWFGFKIFLSLSMMMIFMGTWVSLLVSRFRPEYRIGRFDLKTWGYKLMLVSIVIRFCIPAVAIVSDKIYDLFLKDKYTESVKSLEKVNEEIKNSSLIKERTKVKPDESGYLGKLKKMYTDTTEAVNIKDKIAYLKEKISDYAEYTINLIIVFILQTVIIPVFVLWLLIRFIRYIYGNNTKFYQLDTVKQISYETNHQHS
ncbi:MAG: hypothetical protein GY795_49490 [Desulfobacterales bacterium]|nr:hypothetical protein [Desulfobacterales bacterium]